MYIFTRILFITSLVMTLLVADYAIADNFPVKGSMKTRVNFWLKVYTEAGTHESIAHDTDDLSIIYTKIKTSSNRRKKRNILRRESKRLRRTILSIAKKNYVNLNKEEKRIATVLGERTNRELKRLARNFRFQGGLRDRYLKGLKNSFKYIDYIKKTFKENGLPEELSYLPHVESSFNYKAYSKVGAAGIWQFMRSTGRLYKLKINYVIDERRDPIKATQAAMRLLKDNYQILKRWPLALTAYNHGPQSIKRAIKQVGSRDITKIIEKYNGRRFGFASKNFYATFMATVIISKKPYLYFPQFKKPKKFEYTELYLHRPYTIKHITKATGVSQKSIKEYNFDIRSSAFQSNLYLPKKYKIKLPRKHRKSVASYQKKLKNLKLKKNEFSKGSLHIVSKGENLFDIARLYKTPMNKIIQYNSILDPSKIYPGMKIQIPTKNPKTKTTVALVKKIKKDSTQTQIKLKATTSKNILKEKSLITSLPSLGGKKSRLKPSQNTLGKLDPIINLTKYNLEMKRQNNGLYQINVENEETLGHYSDWSGQHINNIRKLNKLRRVSSIKKGQRILLKISQEKIQEFKLNRNEYHLSIQEDFYNSFIVITRKRHIVTKGQSVSTILSKNNIPYWLLRQYQDEENFGDNLFIGQKIWVPVIEPTSDN